MGPAITSPELAAAVSNVGGLGLISFGGYPPELLRALIHRVRELTSRPFGINMILEFPAAVQQEIADLFRTLDIRFARRILTGIADEWPDATHADIAAFLERWRVSRSGLLQSGYFALHDLVFGAWYSAPVTWTAIGYPGPPNVE